MLSLDLVLLHFLLVSDSVGPSFVSFVGLFIVEESASLLRLECGLSSGVAVRVDWQHCTDCNGLSSWAVPLEALLYSRGGRKRRSGLLFAIGKTLSYKTHSIYAAYSRQGLWDFSTATFGRLPTESELLSGTCLQ